MIRTRSLVVAASLFAALTLSGCEDPCAGLAKKADPAAQELMEKGYEVSIEQGEDECELQPDGEWKVDA